MTKASVKSILHGLRKLERIQQDLAFASASEVDSEDESEHELALIPQKTGEDQMLEHDVDVSDEDDETRELFGEDDDEEVPIDEMDASMPGVQPHESVPLNPESQLLHDEIPQSLGRSEIGMLAVDLAGPFYPDRTKRKYALVAVWVGCYSRKAVALPSVELVSSRLAVEIFSALTRVVNQLENLVSWVLPDVSHDRPRLNGLRIMHLHTDRASEFLGIVAEAWAKENKILATQTRGHSPESNGSTEFWGYAARHVGEILRAHNLKRAGDKLAGQPLPFGSVVAVRRFGEPQRFRPFESQGKLGKLILHETGTRRCFILDASNTIWKGYSLKPILDVSVEHGDFIPSEYIGEEWTRVKLVTGRHAWFHADNGLFRLTPPPILDDTPLERIVEDDGGGMVPSNVDYDLDILPLSSDVPQADSGSHEFTTPDVRPPHATSRSTNEHCAETPTKNEEGYCCRRGRVGYHLDGARVWACRHRPELPRVASHKSSKNMVGRKGLCSQYSESHVNSCIESVNCACAAAHHVSPPAAKTSNRRVRFRELVVEECLEFEVDDVMLSTTQHARRSRCVSQKRNLKENVDVVTASSAQPVGTAKTLARKRREAQALREIPDLSRLALFKAVSVSAEAVRNTKGSERDVEGNDNRVFYKITSERANELQV
eukprot:5954551-Amphidinium_carterae.1